MKKIIYLLCLASALVLTGCNESVCEVCVNWELSYRDYWNMNKENYVDFMQRIQKKMEEMGYKQVHFHQDEFYGSLGVSIQATKTPPYEDQLLMP